VKKNIQELFFGYLFLIPDLIGLIIFWVVPSIIAFIVSLYNWDAIGQPIFSSFSNYRNLWSDPYWIKSLLNTVKYSLIFVPLNFIISLSLALLVKEDVRGIGIYKAIFFASTAMSSVAISFIWKYMFQPYGFVNYIISFFGISQQPLLGSTQQALFCILLVHLYMSVGYYMVIFLAGLNDIPLEYYEASKMDGANTIQRFWFITFPLLKPTSTFVLIMTFLQGFQIFDYIYILTGGGPYYSTSTSVYYMYYTAFQMYHFGYGSSQAFLLFLILVTLSFFMLKVLRSGKVAM